MDKAKGQVASLHVGTYAESEGKGLYPVTLSEDGALSCGEADADAVNASFAAEADGRFFIVDEAAGRLGVFRRGAEGWQKERSVETGGEQPCYVSVGSDGRLAVANYGSGSFALWKLDGDGLPAGSPRLVRSEGSGPVEDRQEGPHCHCAVFGPDGALYVTDLGADAILRLKDGDAEVETVFHAPPGSGPRHLLFHPAGELAVLVSELGSLLTTFEVAEGELRMIESRSTLPTGFSGESLGGHLALSEDGSRVYVSNRGHDSVAVFSLDQAGRIEPLQHVESGGASPRHVLLLEDLGLLVVAHEKDGVVASFRIGEGGTLEPTGHSEKIPGACFVLRTDQ